MKFLKRLFKKKGHQYQYSRLSLSQFDLRKIADEWARVEELVKLGKPAHLRQAVIKADNLLDYALSRLTSGKTTGERLRNARPYFKDFAIYQALWQAHKVRNALVHEADYEPTHTVIRDAIAKFKRGLEALGAELE